MKYTQISKKLIKMGEQDQQSWIQFSKGKITKEDLNHIIENNKNELKSIVEEIGWPTISKVGEKASSYAFLIVQHCHDLDFKKHCLSLMKKENNSEVSKSKIALLTDRILVDEGKPQIYGTQFKNVNNIPTKPYPIRDRKNVDVRRKEMGLEPLEIYAKDIKECYKNLTSNQSR